MTTKDHKKVDLELYGATEWSFDSKLPLSGLGLYPKSVAEHLDLQLRVHVHQQLQSLLK